MGHCEVCDMGWGYLQLGMRICDECADAFTNIANRKAK